MARVRPDEGCGREANWRAAVVCGAALASFASFGGASEVLAQDTEFNGYLENRTFTRDEVGISKFENTLQLELAHSFDKRGPFSALSINGTLRARYEGAYDINSEYGDDAGGPINLQTAGGMTPHGGGTISTGIAFFGFDTTRNPNDGLMVLGSDLHGQNGGVAFGVPVRPCNVDHRGCISGYMDATENELRFPEFNGRVDAVRELYVDATLPVGAGRELGIRLGRQQIVWGRTDLFRVLDVINPVDYSRQNIYDELEDIRIPMWMLQTEYRMGAVGPLSDLNLSVVWNFDKFRPSNLGQSGTPYQILDAASFFRGMKNCWDNGCTVANFAGDGTLSTDFPSHVIGIRQANMPEWALNNSQWGAKVEGVLEGVGFSLNYLDYISQLPSLHGGIPAFNPFTGTTAVWPYLIAFDIDFPRVKLYGASFDIYADAIKSVFRIETAYTTGEEFANTLAPRLYSESDVFRYVVGWDRDIFIRPLNRNKAFLLSTQIFGQHILDHVHGSGPLGTTGMPDFKENWILTALFKGWWMQNRFSPQILAAYDVRAQAAVVSPSIDWIINDRLRLIAAFNIKMGRGARNFDDCRSCNPFVPFTANSADPTPFSPGSLGMYGLEPLGRFRSGPIGMAQQEDEFQLTLRYRF